MWAAIIVTLLAMSAVLSRECRVVLARGVRAVLEFGIAALRKVEDDVPDGKVGTEQPIRPAGQPAGRASMPSSMVLESSEGDKHEKLLRSDSTELDSLASTLSTTTPKSQDGNAEPLECIPVCDHKPTTSSASEADCNDEECAICLLPFEAGQALKKKTP